MNKERTVRCVIAASGGLAKTSDLNREGIENYELVNLCRSGVLERVRHGYYRLADSDAVSDERMIQAFFPEGILCLDSALFLHGYSDRTPNEWTIAVPRSISAAKLHMDLFPYRLYFTPEEYLDIGKTTVNVNGTILSVTDRERTICDCFRYRSKMDSELFNKAIQAYITDDRKNPEILYRYSREMNLFHRVNGLMGVLLNG